MSGSLLPEPEDLTAEQRRLYDTLPLDLTRGLLLTRSSAGPYLALGQSFHHGWLPSPVREMIILRVAARTDSEYERFHHVPLALACGVSEDAVNAILAGSDSVADDSVNAAMVFVDRLVDSVHGAPPDLDTVREHFSPNEIAEMVLLVGHYLMTSVFVSALGIAPEDTPALTSNPPGASDGVT